ncbi:MAG: hybrid sensor histidine kinase/response regulator, partial [Bacteroidetes bacterium]|nr:hybrid sensor histidine kinase/response regulator [Bacteroidota bacterium]
MIELSYQDIAFTFEFAALSFMEPEQNQYAYTLEGYDSSWIYCGNRQYASYINVPTGRYTFRVKGSNNDGVWNEEGTSIAVIISPPFWKTWWAYTLYGLFTLGSLYGIRRYEMNRQRLKFAYELQKVESEKLKAVDLLKSRFFANISHEFRTPLTLILGPIEKWRARTSEQELDTDLGMMGRNAQRLLRLINQVLDLSKIEAGGMKLQATSGDIISFVKSIAQAFQSSAGRRKIALNVEAGEGEIEVLFDRDKMDKILTNLLSNAFDFTPEGGTVTVVLWKDAVTAFIKVSDTGIGIPEEELPHVFDRFHQVDSSHTRGQEGTGIGLALTKELVVLHHGTFGVTSEVGKGTEFTVGLLLGNQHLKPEEIVETPGGLQRAIQMDEVAPVSEPERFVEELSEERSQELPLVLVVEDNADMRAYIKEYLIPEYRVLEACDGGKG